MGNINVTKTFLPPLQEYEDYLNSIWKSGQITNQGALLRKFEEETKAYLNIEDFHFVSNGTSALQLALNSLGITEGEIITTPFSYVATTSAILWERCTPVFVDIDPTTLCIDPKKIESAITNKTKAILAVHVFGVPCDIEAIDNIAHKHDLKVVYDGAHAFGVEYNNASLLSYGDVSTSSFHATKPFHTIEGGCVIAKDKHVSDKVSLAKHFGHRGDEHFELGINAKASEFQAAMGLCNLKYIDGIIAKRKLLSKKYDQLLNADIQRIKRDERVKYNYAYYPVIVESEVKLLNILASLESKSIFPRRYFYPSLNTLPYLEQTQDCPISENIAKRVMCLPLYDDLEEDIVKVICEAVNE